MARTTTTRTSRGISYVAAVAVGLGLLTLRDAASRLVAGPETVPAAIVAAGLLLLSALLFPTSVGLVLGRRWGQYLGIVSFGGVATLQLLPALAGETWAVPLVGIFVAAACSLYLLLASEEFDAGGEPAGPEEGYDHYPWQ